MLDTHVAWLANQGMNYLATGENPARLGNQHPNIVPYQVFPTADGHIVLSVGNDPTFKRFCEAFGLDASAGRSALRHQCGAGAEPATGHRHADAGDAAAADHVVGGAAGGAEDRLRPDQQAVGGVCRPACAGARRGGGDGAWLAAQTVKVIANPVRLSETPADYRIPPPLLGEHTDEVLRDRLGIEGAALAELRVKGVV